MNNALLTVRELFSSIQGEGYLAGRRQIFIRLAECNLDCRYCDTDFVRNGICRMEESPGSGLFVDGAGEMTPVDLLERVRRWNGLLPGAHHSISLTGGEPLLQADLLAALLPDLGRVLPLHLETNGTLPEALQQLVDHLDYISMDIKLPSTSGCGDLWFVHHRFLEIAQLRNTSVKVIVSEATPDEEIRQVAGLITAVDRTTPLFLQPMTARGGGVAIPSVRLMRLQELASSLLPDVRVIPQMHLMLGAL